MQTLRALVSENLELGSFMLPHDFINRAATLDELTSNSFTSGSHAKRNPELGAQRLLAWCRSASNGDWGLFEKRLERDGLALSEVLTKLSTAQVREDVSFDWVEYSRFVYKSLTKSNKKRMKTTTSVAESIPFRDLFEPLLDDACKDLVGLLRNPIFSKQVRTDLEKEFLNSISSLTSQSLLEEFKLFSQKQENIIEQLNCSNSHSEKMYSNFVIYMFDCGFIELFNKKPVLLRLIGSKTKQWKECSFELIERLSNDFHEINNFFSLKKNVRVAEISSSESDLHNGGRSVRIVRFTSGEAIVYKPKNLVIDVKWNNFIERINILGAPFPLKILPTLPRGQYGWTLFVKNNECKNFDEIQDFYSQSGALLALLHLWAASDMHDENIIADGAFPIPIDLEMLLQPTILEDQLRDPAFLAEVAAREKIYNSVFQVGLLPAYSKLESGEIVAQGGLTPQTNDHDEFIWVDLNTEEMRLVRKIQPIRSPQNLPKLNGKVIPINDYVNNFLDGFNKTLKFSQAIVDRTDFLLGIKNAKNVQIRKVIRPTRFYHLLLKRVRDEKNMFDGGVWSASVDFVSRFANLNPADHEVWDVLRAERSALIELNIPFFSVSPNKTILSDYKGVVAKRTGTTGLSKARERLQGLTDKEIMWQQDAIKYATSHMNSNVIVCDTEMLPWTELKANQKDSLSNTTQLIANHLIETSIKAENTRTWIGFDWFGDSQINQLEPLGYDLYNGVLGIAIFLTAQAKISHNENYYNVACSALTGLVANLRSERGEQLARRLGVGGLFGMGSIVYGLTTIAEISGDSEYLEIATIAANLINIEMISSDKQLDLAGGVAGASLGLLKLYRATNDPEILKRAIACGDHLLKSKRTLSKNGKSWAIPQSKGYALNGLSHGAGGFALALYRLWECTDRKDFFEAAEDAIHYENDSYCECESNWPDYRSKWDSNVKEWQSQWCHGGVGIGLSRLCFINSTSRQLNILDDIKAALKSAEISWPRNNDTLCCGSIGTAEFFLQAGKKLDDARLKKRGREMADALLTTAITNKGFKWVGKHNKYHFGFFRGISGIGYSFLRQQDPNLPCVLTFE